MLILLLLLFSLIGVSAIGPALLFCLNLRLYRAPRTGRRLDETVAVLIPARNQERTIRACVESVLGSRDIGIEVWVCDDSSTDRTADVVNLLADKDPRVHLVHCAQPPHGWNGKPHVCWKLARSVTHAPLLLFLDADVRLHPWTIARCASSLRANHLSLLSGFPQQLSTNFLQQLLQPVLQFVVLAFISLRRMQKTTDPKYAAGSGQFLLVDRSAYFASGGHQEIRASYNDGISLPRLFRESGYATNLVDFTRLATSCTQGSLRTLWNFFARKASEGPATRAQLLPFVLLVVLGQVLPLPGALWLLSMILRPGFHVTNDNFGQVFSLACITLVALLANFLPRWIAVFRFRQPFWPTLLHPLGCLTLLGLQSWVLLRRRFHRPIDWEEARHYAHTAQKEAA